MKNELSYILITPYSLQKSRTGGVIARLLSRTDLELVGARMFSPTEEFAGNYAELIKKTDSDLPNETLELLSDYIKENFTPSNGRYQRVMMLLFKGDDAREKLFNIVGQIKPGIRTGETIRDTYSDYVLNRDGSMRYFEPAVIVAPSLDKQGSSMGEEMQFIANFLNKQSNIIDKPLQITEDDSDKRTLVIIKPDNWRYPSSRPGNVIDMLSKTGLRIVGCKLYRMSVEEALEFYGPVQGVLREKLSPKIGEKSKTLLEKEFGVKLGETSLQELTETVGMKFADDQFSQIVEFMSGTRPEECEALDLPSPGKVKSLVLIYQGDNSVEKIRTVLGPTDPTKAPGGTIRRDFGTDVMVNTAHASDSFENAQREMRIIKIEKNDICRIINSSLNG
ncbi:MAG: nucleoside-diphosphate kinase [bacterium]|nr:nucleoside-diphosphate kinase [bacterium]